MVAQAKVSYTKRIENLLGPWRARWTVVHNVDPSAVSASFSKWVAPVKKEIASFESAAKKVQSDDPQEAKIVPTKVVYTVKPPSEESLLPSWRPSPFPHSHSL